MKPKTYFTIAFSLVLILFFFNTCNRNDPEQLELPFTPLGYATVLKLSASPNAVSAGIEAQAVTIRASLTKEGVPLEGKTIIFEICDEFGNKIDLGYFTGGVSVASLTTDSNGRATVTYYTPLASDLLQNVSIYIWATVASEGDEYISNLAPIQIIGPPVEVILNMSADDFTLNAGAAREISNITASLFRQGGAPLTNKTILFEIYDSEGNRATIGYFEGNMTARTRFTDINGEATVAYYGPLAVELPGAGVGDTIIIYIRASVIWLGQVFTAEVLPLYITVI